MKTQAKEQFELTPKRGITQEVNDSGGYVL